MEEECFYFLVFVSQFSFAVSFSLCVDLLDLLVLLYGLVCHFHYYLRVIECFPIVMMGIELKYYSFY